MDRERQVAAYLRIADAALRAGRPHEAEQWYRKALALDPANALALRGLAAARWQRGMRRWFLPAAGFVLALLLLAGASALGFHLLQGRGAPSLTPTAIPSLEAPLPAFSEASALPPWPSAPEEALALATHELFQGLLAEDFARLDVAARSLLQVQRSWGDEEAGEEPMVAAARLTAALEACASRQWSAAAEHLAAVPDLPPEARASLAAGHFLVLLRAGEADLARYVNSLFLRPEHLRSAAGHYQMARALLPDLPQEGDWAVRLEHAPLRFFEDFGEPAAMAQTWNGWHEGAGEVEPSGVLHWGREAGKPLLSRAGEGWRDYALIARLQPEGVGKVGLAVRCLDAEHCCAAWLPAGQEGEHSPSSWGLECRTGERVKVLQPAAGGEGTGRCLVPGAWHVVAVTVAGDQAALTCDGVSLGLVGPLEGPLAGGVGLITEGTGILLDYVAVTDPPALPR
ncbi:MAG: tetratricopeptide repeat protein [Anaerolineae bacterium]